MEVLAQMGKKNLFAEFKLLMILGLFAKGCEFQGSVTRLFKL